MDSLADEANSSLTFQESIRVWFVLEWQASPPGVLEDNLGNVELSMQHPSLPGPLLGGEWGGLAGHLLNRQVGGQGQERLLKK